MGLGPMKAMESMGRHGPNDPTAPAARPRTHVPRYWWQVSKTKIREESDVLHAEKVLVGIEKQMREVMCLMLEKYLRAQKTPRRESCASCRKVLVVSF